MFTIWYLVATEQVSDGSQRTVKKWTTYPNQETENRYICQNQQKKKTNNKREKNRSDLIGRHQPGQELKDEKSTHHIRGFENCMGQIHKCKICVGILFT